MDRLHDSRYESYMRLHGHQDRSRGDGFRCMVEIYKRRLEEQRAEMQDEIDRYMHDLEMSEKRNEF